MDDLLFMIVLTYTLEPKEEQSKIFDASIIYRENLRSAISVFDNLVNTFGEDNHYSVYLYALDIKPNASVMELLTRTGYASASILLEQHEGC